MADLVITAASVLAASGAQTEHGVAGEAVTAGQTLYQDANTKKWLKADNNSATAAAKKATAIALNGAALDQPVKVLKAGDITIGAALTAGLDYYLSDTAGGICPRADLASGEDVCQVGIAKSTTLLGVQFISPGVTL